MDRTSCTGTLKMSAKGLPPTFALSPIGAPCRTCKRKDSPWILFLAQYIVCPIRRQLRAMARPSTSHTSWVMPNCWPHRDEDRRRGSMHPLNTRLALSKPRKAYASFQCEQVKPLWRQQLRQTPRATALCPRESKVPRRGAHDCTPRSTPARAEKWGARGTSPLPRRVVRWRPPSTHHRPLAGRRPDRRVQTVPMRSYYKACQAG